MDVDPHWAGIGGTPALVTQLTTDPRLGVVPADPTKDQPFYQMNNPAPCDGREPLM